MLQNQALAIRQWFQAADPSPVSLQVVSEERQLRKQVSVLKVIPLILSVMNLWDDGACGLRKKLLS